jgi:hypothetical protein
VGFALALGAVPVSDESALVPAPASPARGTSSAEAARAS